MAHTIVTARGVEKRPRAVTFRQGFWHKCRAAGCSFAVQLSEGAEEPADAMYVALPHLPGDVQERSSVGRREDAAARGGTLQLQDVLDAHVNRPGLVTRHCPECCARARGVLCRREENVHLCPRNEVLDEMSNEMEIRELPAYLVMQIKQFKEGPPGGAQFCRDPRTVSAPASGVITVKGADGNTASYRCVGIVRHSGSSPYSGHYTAVIEDLNGTGTWTEANDGVVTGGLCWEDVRTDERSQIFVLRRVLGAVDGGRALEAESDPGERRKRGAGDESNKHGPDPKKARRDPVKNGNAREAESEPAGRRKRGAEENWSTDGPEAKVPRRGREVGEGDEIASQEWEGEREEEEQSAEWCGLSALFAESEEENDEAADAMDFADMPALVEISGAEFVAETVTEEVWSGVEAEREGCPGGEVEER